ncbi:D-alanyl-D-alanine carboxypeptidase/D-alanyl-D-alanine-endopeptidase [Gloeothece citriformis PCC 7424]|uniref:D-alanyl-D-alanine carboxypeptidase/D-alanyl-D-alanine-endopeptidase n=1 Tax=Gloeothece citriformis (strain PCC 7424) TaxID=65393 RepID=B7K701_GLOC7|nr:D-alanyl-D-alanine carboxypeptidase/D-alanyl-D-alanine-endopeptidase [Gloeothece citriformis]ACK72700.1 D-alanyl-D-alanine carboxypeptidase/D-alanyl-D-alanine-endopeptidase [Gloeothece citriformis PCC 7424]
MTFKGLKTSFLGLIFGLVVQFPGFAQSICPSNLGQEIEAVIQRPEWRRSRWGILVETLEDGQILYGVDENQYFVPASNTKLLTTAAALRVLGADFRVRTSVYGVGEPPILASLRVVGRGDPSLTNKQLKLLAQQLKEKGVQQISELIVDDSYFKELPLNPSWEWSDLLFYYTPSVNSLILNENTSLIKIVPQGLNYPAKLVWSDAIVARQWRVYNDVITTRQGSRKTIDFYRDFEQPIIYITGQLPVDDEGYTTAIAVADPASYFLESFRSILLEEGIKVNRATIIKESSRFDLGEELAFVESPPLGNLIDKINGESNNLFAEAILRILGSESRNQMGVEVIKENLIDLGIEEDSFSLADGSGLSRQNLVTPETLVQVLRLMAQSPDAEIYQNSLAVAGEKGTLQRRFLDTDFVGNLQGKTGTLTGVSALSGYLFVPNYQPLVFSIMINYTDQPGSNLRKAIDEIIILMSQLDDC